MAASVEVVEVPDSEFSVADMETGQYGYFPDDDDENDIFIRAGNKLVFLADGETETVASRRNQEVVVLEHGTTITLDIEED